VITFPLILLATLSFWFFYSGNPFNAGSGWFLDKVKTPENIVPAQYQFDFITPINKINYEYPCATLELGGDSVMFTTDNKGTLYIGNKNSQNYRFATFEEKQEFVSRFKNNYKGKKLAIAPNGKIIVDNNYEYPIYNAALLDDIVLSTKDDGIILAKEYGSDVERLATPEEAQRFVDYLNGVGGTKYSKLLILNNGKVVRETIYEPLAQFGEFGEDAILLLEKSTGLLFLEGEDEQLLGLDAEMTLEFVNKLNSLEDFFEDGDKLVITDDGKICFLSEQIRDIYAEHSEHHTLNIFEEESHHFHLQAMLMSLLIAGCGILLAFVVYQWRQINADKVATTFKPLYKLSFNKWYIDEIYEKTFIGGTLLLSKILSFFDNKVVDGFVNFSATMMRGVSWFTGKFDNLVVDGFVNLTAWTIGLKGRIIRQMQTGVVQTYIAFSIIILMVIAFFFV
ncbi:MAG: hypothetical protein FWG85_04825, partial [Bacteroidetes bacterium]|nr:hypothetical protein [Bacteroidota bacterium]